MNRTIIYHILFLTLCVYKVESESNLARDKIASQSSVLNGAVAGRAVDGIREPQFGLSEQGCAGTDGYNRPDNWWMVDLEQPYVVLTLKVFNMQGWKDNLNRFNVKVSNSSNIDDHHELCVYHEGPVPGGSNVTLYCQRELIGQYVSIQKTTNRPGSGYLFLCEVEVYGYTYTACAPDKYGENCNRDCYCQEACTDILGVCPGQCVPGKKTNRIAGQIGDCRVDCPDGTFGADCVGRCHCEGGVLCDKESGVCPGGRCENRYGGRNCSVELPKLVNAPEYLTQRSTSIHIRFRQFDKSRGDQGNGPVTEYQVQVYNLNNPGSVWDTKATTQHDNTRTHIELKILNLEYNTEYSIRVVAVYDDGNERIAGLPSPELNIKTRCKAPDPPVWMEPTLTGSTLYFKWQLNPGGHRCESYDRVQVRYRLMSSGNVQTKTVYKNQLSNNGTDIAVILRREYSLTLVVYNNEDIEAESGPHTYYTGIVPSSTKTTTESTLESTSTQPLMPVSSTPKRATPAMTASTAIHSSPLSTTSSVTQAGAGGSNAGMIAGVTVAVIIVTIIAVLVAIFLIRSKRRDKQNSTSTTKHKPKDIPLSERQYENLDGDTTRINLADLSTVVDHKKLTGALEQQYKRLVTGSAGSEVASKPENITKNRDPNIRPYDKNRVKLSKVIGDGLSDYINASNIKGLNNNMYIATQVPTEETVGDFWRMIWERKVNRIVLLMHNQEFRHQYWDVEGTKMFGRIKVTSLETAEISNNQSIRHFGITTTKGPSRTVYLFMLSDWAENTIPPTTLMLNFVHKIRKYKEFGKGPIVVQCKCGAGRTGTFIALDNLLDQIKTDNKEHIDVYEVVQSLISQRVQMVDNMEQYIFLHDVLVEYLLQKEGRSGAPYDELNEDQIDSHSGLYEKLTDPNDYEEIEATKLKKIKSMDQNIS